MKKVLLFLLSTFLLTAQAEEINTPLIHTDEIPLAVDISPVIRFETDETGVFAVVTVEPLAASVELPVPTGEPEVEAPAAFMLTTIITNHSITYTMTPIGETAP